MLKALKALKALPLRESGFTASMCSSVGRGGLPPPLLAGGHIQVVESERGAGA